MAFPGAQRPLRRILQKNVEAPHWEQGGRRRKKVDKEAWKFQTERTFLNDNKCGGAGICGPYVVLALEAHLQGIKEANPFMGDILRMSDQRGVRELGLVSVIESVLKLHERNLLVPCLGDIGIGDRAEVESDRVKSDMDRCLADMRIGATWEGWQCRSEDGRRVYERPGTPSSTSGFLGVKEAERKQKQRLDETIKKVNREQAKKTEANATKGERPTVPHQRLNICIFLPHYTA